MNACVLSLAPLYCMSAICPSMLLFIHLSCSVMSYLNAFILALAFTLVLMCCIIVLIFPEWQITSVSYLRGFPASAISFLTVILNLISANPDVLVRGKKNKVLLTIRHQKRVLHHKSEVFVQSLSMQMLTGIICVQRKRLSLMNPLIGSLIGCS